MTPILFVTHTLHACGVYQFGKQLCEALEESEKFRFIFCDVDSPAALHATVLEHAPKAILVNWHPATLRWAEGWPLWSLGLPVIGIMHEMSVAEANESDNTLFDYYVLHDPSADLTNPLCYRMGRPLHQTKIGLHLLKELQSEVSVSPGAGRISRGSSPELTPSLTIV